MEIKIDIPEEIWNLFKGGESGIKIGDDIAIMAFKVGVYQHAIDSYKNDFPKIALWATGEIEKATKGMDLKSLFQSIADSME